MARSVYFAQVHVMRDNGIEVLGKVRNERLAEINETASQMAKLQLRFSQLHTGSPTKMKGRSKEIT